MSTLRKALQIAREAHAGQTDKAGEPYFLHPLTVMCKMHTEPEMIAALLHDLIEDTAWTIQDLQKEGFGEEALKAVDLLTKRKNDGGTYANYIAGIKGNPIAVKVKIADLEHNMDTRRLARLTGKDKKRLKKYYKTWCELKAIRDC